MSINSVNTNMGAMIALQSLNRTNSDLAATQKRISTGQRVADSTDDGAAYAVAQSVRSTIGGLTTANNQLGNVQGLLATTQTGLNDVSKMMTQMHNTLVTLSTGTLDNTARQGYQAQYASQLANLKTFIQDAGYNGKTLIGDIGGSNGAFGRVASVRNDVGASYGVATFSGKALYGAIAFTAPANATGTLGVAFQASTMNTAATPALRTNGKAYVQTVAAHGTIAAGKIATNAAGIASLLTAGGSFMKQMNSVGSALNTVGAEVNYVNNQISYNNDKVDALNTGLGALVDADLAKESAQLQALQIRQQLGTQALSLANQAPQTLLSLFK